ncbi:MAG TPA: alpha-2-macroglobulin family protein, partial [Turneriella sp.]|nr:alpha-2-macroglobulin family protein [Turneriella sp.]
MRFLRLLLFTILGFVYPLSALEIYINRAFTTTEKAEATCYASGEGPLFLRVYRIDDVETYLTGQANAHTAEEKSERLMQPGYFLWRSVVDNFEYSLYQLARRYMRSDYRNLLRDYLGLQKYQFPFRDRFPETNLFAPLAYPVVFEKKIQVRAQYWHSLKQQFESLKAGYYLVEISQGRHIAHAPLVISDIAMVTKISPYNFLVYAVDLLKNKPLSNADLSVYSREKSGKIEKHILKENFKLKDGLLFSNDVGYLKNSQSTLYVLRQGSHYAFSDIYALDTTKSLYESAIYTERPVYRIGDIVQVRAVFVRKQGAAAHGKVKYSIKKGDEILYTSESPLTEAGSLAFTFKTDTLKPARYTILMEIQGEKHYGNFLIEQYKKPETRANIRVDKNILLNGETINADLTAQYFSGEPLSKASVEVTLERMRISFPWWYGFSGSEYYGDWNDYARWDFVKEYTAVLDAKGKLKIPVATSEKGIEAPTDSDYIYRVRAKVKAQNREETQASARFKVYRAPVQLRLTQNSWYFSAGAPITFNVNATSIYTDKPVSLRVQATLYQRTYDSKARRYNDNAVASQEILLPNSGYKEAEFTGIKKSGTYLVRVSATDAGRTTTDTLETYVYGEELFYTDNSAERNISISADKKEYNLFDTAAFAIQMPSEKKIPALVVIENDRIRKFKLFESVDASWIYKEELKNNLTPNFDISVLAFDYDKVPRFYSGQTQVVLPPQYRALTLEVTSDRERYRPGEEANFIVRTFDYQKKPVSAEFSLGVVDEAIYALHEDALKSLSLALNPRLTNSVVTANSLAFSFYGYGTEKSLYALYRNQMAEAAALKKGERERLKIRKNFKDTAFFMANGKTDASGLAKVHVPLPDNLTEWRITTHAHTRAGLSASGRTKITVSKDFALRLAKPRFLRERDEAQLRLLISNQLKEKQTAALEAQFENIKLVSKFPKTLDIPAGEEKYIDFKITNDTFPKEGKARLQFIARTQSDNDGLEMELPLLPYGVENFIASQKIFAPNEKTWQSTLQLPNGGRENLGTVNVSFTPGVLPSVHETLPYLIQYPYGCVEQTLSTFLPVLWASEASEKLKIPLPVKKQQFDA